MTLYQAEVYLLAKNKKITYINYSLNDRKFIYEPEEKIQKSDKPLLDPELFPFYHVWKEDIVEGENEIYITVYAELTYNWIRRQVELCGISIEGDVYPLRDTRRSIVEELKLYKHGLKRHYLLIDNFKRIGLTGLLKGRKR